jgi:hypothetical protein
MDGDGTEHEAAVTDLLEAGGGEVGGEGFGCEEALAGFRQVGVGVCVAGDEPAEGRDDGVVMQPDEWGEKAAPGAGGIQADKAAAGLEDAALLTQGSLSLIHI